MLYHLLKNGNIIDEEEADTAELALEQFIARNPLLEIEILDRAIFFDGYFSCGRYDPEYMVVPENVSFPE